MSTEQATPQTIEPASFAQQLRSGTWRAHEGSESHDFSQALLAGELPQEGYAELVAQHYFVYEALEEVGRTLAEDPVGRAVYFPELHRLPALERDLAHLCGPLWRESIRPTLSTVTYAARIRQMAQWPAGFVAHHYTRYLGDLSGGQFIKRIVRDAYRFEGVQGIEFYVFDEIKSLPKFKNAYRAALDGLPLTTAEQERVIAETRLAYQFNNEMMADLGRVHSTPQAA
ncbi:heme oxygenase (biliverdin-producing) [Nocardiopsis ansamitocini]|uniref:biliverdin-producing heme oxygenase n=1 Tax=Nocardiopsis ansamitocini TaxID=1670832 RepID=UPI002554F0E5|nr:biliverdin-producing heme oxygenase [Nocardiopsis ansamitocini]